VRFALPLLAVLLLAADSPDSDRWAKQRERMVRETIAEPLDGRPPITDPLVLTAMRTVERHRFVPVEWRGQSYADAPLPIGHDQTISQPYIVALMTALAEPKPGHKVLEVGTGSGYQAAVLAEIVDHVWSIEIVEPLATRADADLKAAGYTNITVKHGDGYVGWPEHAPFDSILVTAAPDHVPQPLTKQLKVGGRLVLPVGPTSWTQELVVLTKQEDGSVERTAVMPVRFVPLTGEHGVPPDDAPR